MEMLDSVTASIMVGMVYFSIYAVTIGWTALIGFFGYKGVKYFLGAKSESS